MEPRSLEGWEPSSTDGYTMDQIIDMAFQYRGDVTIAPSTGEEITGYLFNRDASVPEPFVEMFTTETGERVRLLYQDVSSIRFTGRDTAAGQFYEAWKARREAARQNLNHD